MNYLKIYNQLIEKRKINPPTEYFEEHHIKPKSLFPELSKDKNNLVKLTYREHYLAHHLLYRHYKSIGDKEKAYKMICAWKYMCINKDGLHISINEFEKVKKIFNEEIKIKYKGSGNPFYGRHLSEEHKKKMSKSLKGRNAWNKGLKISEEYRNKLSQTHIGQISAIKGKICVNNGIIMKYVNQNEIPNGFIKGRLKKYK